MTAPPFERTNTAVALIGEILRLVGRYEGLPGAAPQPQLRKQNRIKTISATTAIEGNTLTLDQVSAVFDGKRVLGPKKDILEVKNAIKVYESADRFVPDSVPSLLKAHKMLLKGLLANAGRFRTESVGVFKGGKAVHTAPPAERVEWLVKDLFTWSRKATAEHPLIRSAVVHYELAFIHPFMDGNGRTARFWQHMTLTHYAPVFEFVPIESVVQERQADYYKSLGESDSLGSSTPFIEFSLQALHDALADVLIEVRPLRSDATSRLKEARAHFGALPFSRKDYMALQKMLSPAQASRDLRHGVDSNILVPEGKAARTRYRFSGA